MQRIDEARMAEGNGRTGRLWHTRFEIARRSIDDGMKNGVADMKVATPCSFGLLLLECC